MKAYINKNKKYILLMVVIVISIAFFGFKESFGFKNVYEMTRTALFAGTPATPTVTLGTPKYYTDDGRVNASEAYVNKVTSIQFDLILTSVDDTNDIYVKVLSPYQSDVTSNFRIVKTLNRITLQPKNDVFYHELKEYTLEVYAEKTVQVEKPTSSTTTKSTTSTRSTRSTTTTQAPVEYEDVTLTSSTKTQTFMFQGKYYGATVDNTILTNGSGRKDDYNNYWLTTFKDVENMDFSKFTLDSAYLVSSNRDYTEFFNISNHGDNWMTIHSTPYTGSGWWGNRRYLANGMYRIVFKYSNPDYSTALGDLYFETFITVSNRTSPTLTEDLSKSQSRRLIRNNISYVLKRVTNNSVYITTNGTDTAIDKNNFVQNYSGVDIYSLKYDDDGYILYEIQLGVTIKTADEENVYYYDENNVYQTMARADFEAQYGVIDTNTYQFADGHTYMNVEGYYRSYDTSNKTIRSAGGGKIISVYNYNGLEEQDFESASVTISHEANDTYSSTEQFNVYQMQFHSNSYWNPYYGYYTYNDYGTPFTFTWSIDTNAKTITTTIVYDDVQDVYAGPYSITIDFVDLGTVKKSFTIEDAPVDFVLSTSVDAHDDSAEPLSTSFPPGNKNYEYYLSLRMVKGEIDPSYQYNNESLQTHIYSKRSDIDSHGNQYFYDQVDYTIIIDKYINNKVTYRYSTDQAEYYNLKNYVTRTETLDGTSDFETKYKHAYDYLQYYIFDENGNIDRTKDNIPRSIIRRETINKVDYLTFMDSQTTTMTTESYNYIKNGGYADSLVYAYQYLDYGSETNGVLSFDVNRGVINGFYTSQTYPYSDEYDVTDLFNVTYNDDLTDTERAITILPKTEVPAGDYYPYVYYNSELTGVGYLNNGINSDGTVSDEVVITKDKYPENWNRNIHMSIIRYLDPVYEIEVGDPRYSNSVNDDKKAYFNVDSEVDFMINPKDIYNYGDITYKIEYTPNVISDIPEGMTEAEYVNTINWTTIDPSKYEISYAKLNNVNELEDIDTFEYDKDFDGTYYIKFNFGNDMPKGQYRLVVDYTNPDSNISLTNNPYCLFLLNDRYYGLIVNQEKTGNIEFPHNYSLTKDIYLDGEYITHPENITTNIYYMNDGIKVYLTKDGNTYKYNNNGTLDTFYNTTSEITTNPDGTIEYHVSFSNVANVNHIGDYGYEFIYQEEGYSESKTVVNFKITEDQYYIDMSNEYPKANEYEMSFAKDLETMFIDDSLIPDINYTVLHWNESSNKYEDVSSIDVTSSERHIREITTEDISCTSPTCTAKVRFYINKNKVDMEGDYLLRVKYMNTTKEYDITNFVDMFAWNIEEESVTSVYNYEEDGEQKSEVVEGFYKNLDDIQINVKIDNDIHEDNIKYSINTSCITDTICDPTSNAYNDLFDVVNTTGTDRKIKLTPKRNDQGKITMPNGTYALVLYYESSYYHIVRFDVHSEYASISYDSVTQKSTFINNGSNEEVEGLYSSLDGTMTIDTTIKGVPYTSVNRYIVNSLGTKVNKFDYNTVEEFNTTHMSMITYNHNNRVEPGIYTYVTEYTALDGEVTKEEYQFTIYENYFDFEIYGFDSNPNPLIINRSGEAIFNIRAKNIQYLTKDENNNMNNGRVYDFMRNSKVFDYNGNDVTNKFTFEVATHQDTLVSGEFDIRAKFKGVTLGQGGYRYQTSITIGNKVVTKDYWIVIDEADRYINIGELEINSNTSDGKIHNSDGGTYIINYEANTEYAYENIDVQVTSESSNVTDKFIITKDETHIYVRFDPNTSEIDEGDYNINITYAGNVDIVAIHMYGEYVSIAQLTSDKYQITYGEDSIIYVDSLSALTLKYSTFLTHLQNLQPSPKLLDKNGNNITSASAKVGTGMKFVNEGDATYTIVVIGDLNQDGSISLGDVALLFQYVTGTRNFDDRYRLLAASVRKKENVTLADVAILFQFATGNRSSI
jgi:hypothetical protein